MDIRSLYCVIALIEEAHFGRAANRLNITQPAFSQRIAALEEEVGHRLFTRNRGPIKPTEAGLAFARRAQIVIDNAEAATTDARLAARGKKDQLRIGFTPVALYQNFPRIVTQFRKAYPDINIEMKELLSLEQEQALRKGTLDIGLVHPPLVDKDLMFQSLESINLVLAIPTKWEQSKQTTISLEDCSDMPFLLPPRVVGPVFYDAIIAACHRAGFYPKVIEEVAPMPTLIGLISSGMGAGFVTEGMLSIQRSGVSFLRVNNALPKLPLALAWKRNANNSAIQHFIQTVEQ